MDTKECTELASKRKQALRKAAIRQKFYEVQLRWVPKLNHSQYTTLENIALSGFENVGISFLQTFDF